MTADQKQSQPQQQISDEAAAGVLARELWTWLGSKTRNTGLVESWIPMLVAAKAEADVDWSRMREIVRWSALVNEYTVENLRLARDPGKSLLVNQWENVVLRFEAWEAAELARARKKWKNGPCPGCNMAEAKPLNRSGYCDRCKEAWRRRSSRVEQMLFGLESAGIVKRVGQQWFVLYEPIAPGVPISEASIAIRGEHWLVLEGGNSREMNRDERIVNMVDQILNGGHYETLEALYKQHCIGTGFDVAEIPS